MTWVSGLQISMRARGPLAACGRLLCEISHYDKTSTLQALSKMTEYGIIRTEKDVEKKRQTRF